MKVLVLGGNGATGIHVVEQLLENKVAVKTIVRNSAKLTSLSHKENLEIITASILDMDNAALSEALEDVDAIVSCLGHNITLKGIWGKPRRLVTDAIRKVYASIRIKDSGKVTKLVLMNTTACLDVDAQEKFTNAEGIIIAIMRFLLPPQRDNEQAVNFLKHAIGKHNRNIKWIAVRPDTLIDETEVTSYAVHNSPVRSPVFNSGKTSRKNIGSFIMNLLCNNEQWEKWKYQMPVIYNETSQ